MRRQRFTQQQLPTGRVSLSPPTPIDQNCKDVGQVTQKWGELSVTEYGSQKTRGPGLLSHHAPCPHSQWCRTPRKPHSPRFLWPHAANDGKRKTGTFGWFWTQPLGNWRLSLPQSQLLKADSQEALKRERELASSAIRWGIFSQRQLQAQRDQDLGWGVNLRPLSALSH